MPIHGDERCVIPAHWKLPHFLSRISETLSLNICRSPNRNCTAKLGKCFSIRNTRRGIVVAKFSKTNFPCNSRINGMTTLFFADWGRHGRADEPEPACRLFGIGRIGVPGLRPLAVVGGLFIIYIGATPFGGCFSYFLTFFEKKMPKYLQVRKKSLPLHPRLRKTRVLTKIGSLQ